MGIAPTTQNIVILNLNFKICLSTHPQPIRPYGINFWANQHKHIKPLVILDNAYYNTRF